MIITFKLEPVSISSVSFKWKLNFNKHMSNILFINIFTLSKCDVLQFRMKMLFALWVEENIENLFCNIWTLNNF